MLANICVVVAVLWAIGFVVLIVIISRAPAGWEDENGFHYGDR